jgi:hypothetical protein
MFLSRRQNSPDIQIPHINLLILPPLLPVLTTIQFILTTLKYLQFRIRIRRQKERQRISLLARLIPDPMHSSRKLPIRLLLEILAYITYESTCLGRCIDPDAVLVQDLKGRDRVLENEG